MSYTLYQYNGVSINDGTNFSSIIPLGSFNQNKADPSYAYRNNRPPIYGIKTINDSTFSIEVAIKEGVSYDTNLEMIQALFSPSKDQDLKKLTLIDSSAKVWYVYCTPIEVVDFRYSMITVNMACPDMTLYSNTTSSVTQNLTSSPGTFTMSTIDSNLPVFTTFEITPTSSSAAGYRYRRHHAIYYQPPANGSSEFYKYPIGTIPYCLTVDTASLLKDNSNKVLVNLVGGITASATSIPYDTPTGSLTSSGVVMIDSEQIIYTGKTATNITGCTRGAFGTTAATHADNATIYLSKVANDQRDIDIFVNDNRVSRWISTSTWNTATTKIWFLLPFPKRSFKFTVEGTISGTGTPSFIQVQSGQKDDYNALQTASPGGGCLLIDNELFTFTAYDSTSLKFTQITRAERETTAASHSANTAIYVIDNKVYAQYGSEYMTAKTNEDSIKPLIDMDNSTNSSWIFNEFYSATNTGRYPAWFPAISTQTKAILDSQKSRTFTGELNLSWDTTGAPAYTADEGDDDPATTIGIAMKSYQSAVGGSWASDTVSARWSISLPMGLNGYPAFSGKYIQGNVAKAGTHKFIYSKFVSPTSETTFYTVPSSAVVNASIAISYTYSANASVNYPIALSYVGTSTATGTGAYTKSVGEIQTMTFSLYRSPTINTSTEISAYQLTPQISNSTTGLSFSFDTNLLLNGTITVDCENKLILNSSKSTPTNVTLNTNRSEWLTVNKNDVITYTESGLTGVTVTISWVDKKVLSL